MRKFSMKATVIGTAVAMAALTAVSVGPAAAFGGGGHGGGHGGGGHGGGHGGGFHGGGWGHHGGGWGHHRPWFGHRHGWGWGGYGGYYGRCVIKRFYDGDGDVTISKVCY